MDFVKDGKRITVSIANNNQILLPNLVFIGLIRATEKQVALFNLAAHVANMTQQTFSNKQTIVSFTYKETVLAKARFGSLPMISN